MNLISSYTIDEKIFDEFIFDKQYDDDFWKLKMNEWTPLKDRTFGLKDKWSNDMYNFTLKYFDDDINYHDTKNFKASIVFYENGHIDEHYDRGSLSIIYNIEDGLEYEDKGVWRKAPKGLISFDGLLGVNPVKHRVLSNTTRKSLQFFAAPSNVDYPWTL